MSATIIVGYDGSNTSAAATAWAADEASARHAPLRIVSCYDIPVVGDAALAWGSSEAYAELLDIASKNASDMRDSLTTTHPQLEVTTDTSAGPASAEILTGVDAHDLVVVGASSRAGAAAFWLGSTPRHLVRHSPCPVVVVRGPSAGHRPQRIVVGVDGSEDSNRALMWAADEADQLRVDLVVVHAWSYAYSVADVASAQARDTTRVDAACVLDKALERARERTGATVIGELIENTPVPGLIDFVREDDLLVVGSRGRGAMSSAVFGSTANSLLEHSPGTVVVVPHAAVA